MSSQLCILELNRLTRIEYGSQKHNYICNIQGVSVYTNVSANYMLRPLLVRPSSGWIPWSEELYNNAILKSGGTRSRLQKWACVQTGSTSIKICALFTLVCGNILSIIGRLVRVVRGLGVSALFVGSGRGGWVSQRSAVVVVWSCGRSKLYTVAAPFL